MTIITPDQLADLRTHPHRAKFYLAVHVPRALCYCQVDDPDIERGERVIHYKNAAWQPKPGGGVYQPSDIEYGMTLYVGSGEGFGNKGRVRIITPMADAVVVAENEHIEWADGDWLMIGNIFEPWSIFPRIIVNDPNDPTDVIIYQDWGFEYSDQNDKYPPVAVMGPPAVGFLDGGECSIYFDGSRSYGVGGAAIAGYEWTFPGGDPATSVAATPGYVKWTAATSVYVSLKVTDTNDKIHVGHRWVRVYDCREPAYAKQFPYNEFEVTNLGATYSEGSWRAGFVVRDQWGRLGPSYFRDNAQVVLVCEGLGDLPIGGTFEHRPNILYVGWVIGETIRYAPETNDVSFETAGICGRMAVMDSFPDYLEIPITNQPTKWFEARDLDVDLALLTHLRWRSTILHITDVYCLTKVYSGWYPGTPWAVWRTLSQDFQQGDLYSQCDQLMRAAVGRMLSDKFSAIYCRVDPQVYPTAYRAGLPTWFELTDDDWRDEIQFQRAPLDAVSQIDLGGLWVEPGGTDPETDVHPILSLAPGTTPRYEGVIEKVDGLVLEGQVPANVLAGDILGWRNNSFPSISVPLTGMYTFLDIAPMNWVTWTLAAEATKRGIAWTGARFIPRGLDVRVDNAGGFVTVRLELEKEADGPDGVTGIYPPEEPEEPIEHPPETPPEPLPPPGPTPGTWRKHVLACGSGGVFYTSNFVSDHGPGGTPTWQQKNGGLVYGGNPDTDCWMLGFQWMTPEACHYVMTRNCIYRRRPAISDNWVPMLTKEQAAALGGVDIDEVGVFWSIGTNPWGEQANHLYAMFHGRKAVPIWGWEGRLYFLRSLDQGVSWTAYKISSGVSFQGTTDLQLYQHEPCNIRFCSWRTSPLGGWKVRRSNDGGLTWPQQCVCGDVFTNHVAYNCPVDDQRVYSIYRHGSGAIRVKISTDGGLNFTPVADQGGWYPQTYSNMPGKHWFNAQLTAPGLARCSDGVYIYKSLNFGVAWTRHLLSTQVEDCNTELVPDAVNKLYLSGGSNVQATEDEGATMYDKRGVAPTNITGEIRDLTPIWTLE